MPAELTLHQIPTAHASVVDTLVSDAFGYQKPHRYFQDFPVWGSDAVKRFGLFEGKTLVSHVGMRVVEIGAHRVGLVGGVATDESHRGHGLSSRLLEHMIEQGRAQKCDWLVLWGSEHGFYAKVGFHLAGVQTRLRLSDLMSALPVPSATSVLNVRTGYTPRIFDALLAQKDSNSIAWKPTDRDWFEKHQTVKWYWIDKPFAFLGFERGMDLPHLVHEIGGAPAELAALFATVLQEDPQAELLTHPSHFARLGLKPTTPHSDEMLCLAKQMEPGRPWPKDFWISGLNAC